jgi:hypothetical protein
MFIVTEADAAAIRAVFDREGELSAAIELRRRFPGITDNAETAPRSFGAVDCSPGRFAASIQGCYRLNNGLAAVASRCSAYATLQTSCTREPVKRVVSLKCPLNSQVI